ncbi:MAG TPA: DUF366 family protein [Chloroflexia bacterium]|nr:DUF366 family protein [Chloroflexia bacterium]
MLKKYLGGANLLTYDGLQLAPHWIYRQHDLLGDAIVSFRGPCEVKLTEMVDIEDVKASAPIYSPQMIHFIAEFFDLDLEKTVYRQRLLIVTAKEWLEERLDRPVTRRGDDLYLARPGDGKPGKLSVSIATSSPVSTLIHTGFNVLTEGTPVPTVGLAELKIDPDEFAEAVLDRYTAEVEDIWLARCKVRPVI